MSPPARLRPRSVTEHFRETASPTAGGGQLPGVFLFYDLSPIKASLEGRAFLLCPGTSRTGAAGHSCVLPPPWCMLCFSPTACHTSLLLPHFSPQVRFQESRLSFLSFLTSLCAIIGGVFTGGWGSDGQNHAVSAILASPAFIDGCLAGRQPVL